LNGRETHETRVYRWGRVPRGVSEVLSSRGNRDAPVSSDQCDDSSSGSEGKPCPYGLHEFGGLIDPGGRELGDDGESSLQRIAEKRR